MKVGGNENQIDNYRCLNDGSRAHDQESRCGLPPLGECFLGISQVLQLLGQPIDLVKAIVKI